MRLPTSLTHSVRGPENKEEKSSAAESVPCICEAVGSIPSTQRTNPGEINV